MLSDRQARLQPLLDRLLDEDGLQGAVLVSRDGFCMMNRIPRLPGADTFSAMSATLIGAADAAFGELGEDRVSGVLVETPKSRMAVVNVTREMVLVVLAAREDAQERDAAALMERARRAAEDVHRALSS